ncbi:TPA: sensor histidine kinase [Streptococcus agalactiae]
MKNKKNNYDLMYFIPLVFLIYPIGGILYYHYPFWTLFFTLAFVGAYLYSVIIRGESKYHMTAWSTMLTYIFYMTIFINSGFIWYIYFLSNLLVYRFRDKLKSFRFISFACTLATVVFLCFFKASDFGDRIMFLIVPIFCIGYMWIAIENRNSEEQREKIAEQNQYINILSAENERNRIGRDLHDSLGHTFAMMTLKTELALKLLEKRNYDKVQKELSELNHISHQSMSEVRQIVSNLKYRTVVEEIDKLYRLFQLSNIKLTVVNKLETSQLSPVTQSTITMILKELSNNIVKHAEADSVELSLVRQGATINIEMIDNGCGFTNLDGDELHSIQERLTIVEGTLTILSRSKPTHIQVVLKEV